MKGQRSAILNHLQEHKTLTSKEAFELFGATRLSAIIHDFKDMGYQIVTVMVDGKTKFGDSCKYAKYYYIGKIGDDEQ